MKLDAYNSQKIKVISFLMIIMVVYIHSYYIEAETRTLPNFVQHLGGALTSVAVPMFYAISGFLFFNGIKSIEQCFPKIRKRVHTLLVPYLIWNIVFILWYVMLTYAPGTSKYVNSDMFSNLSIEHPLSTLYILFVKPVGFHLWFLRDLILFVVLTPLLYSGIKKTKWLAFFVLLLATGWMTRFWITSFALGGTLAICYDNGLEILHVKYEKIVYGAIIVYILSSIMIAFGLLSSQNGIFENYLIQLIVIVSMFAVWNGYDLLVKKDFVPSKWFTIAMNYTFFIYLFHEPVFNIIKKLGLKIFGCGDTQLIMLYVLNPIIMAFIAVIIGCAFQHIFPCVYSILVGGRSK